MARFSIGGLLIAVAFVAVGCAALKYASPVWFTVLSGVALLVSMGTAIIALVGKGEQRGRAIGFMACFVLYGAVVVLSPKDEGDVRAPFLPTTKALDFVGEWVEQTLYFDIASGTALPGHERQSDKNYSLQLEPFSSDEYLPNSIGFYRWPKKHNVAKVGHILWALLFGFLGSLFAGFVYRRNQ